MVDYLIEKAGFFSYLAGGASIISFISIFIFFAGVGVFGPINDFFSIWQMVLMIPLALALHQMFKETSPTLSFLITTAAILAMLVFGILQALLLLGQVKFVQTLRPILLLGVVVGIWWIAIGAFTFSTGIFPKGLGAVAMVAGVSFILTAVGFWLGGQEHLLAAAGFLFGGVTSPWLMFWLGKLLS